MSALMCLGSAVFRVIGLNFHTVETETEAHWAEFPRFGLEDGAQYIGRARTTQTIRGLLFPVALGGLADYDGLRAMQSAGVPVPMLRMGRGFAARMLGLVTIEHVSDREDYISAGGTPQRLSFDVSVKSYEGGR